MKPAMEPHRATQIVRRTVVGATSKRPVTR
jgi:hypothetical protein